MDQPDLKSPQHYINRELSLLAFNERVLAQALDARIPLLERLKFLCISSGNRDEFFEIQCASPCVSTPIENGFSAISRRA
jgi:polyphosphate kinase